MNPALLESVLSCPKLPSLPTVAVKVLELTRDPNLSLTRIAQTVQADPALAVRVLKTVNSSYYGLSHPCPSITRAMGMLGLNTVKAIVLGFSLVESTAKAGVGDVFDMTAYWRRGVYSAAAARAVAMSTKACDPEEAFIAALLQDIGLLACFASIRAEYQQVIDAGPKDHDDVCGFERILLGFDHQSVGRALAEKWRLPKQLAEAIAAHHSPDDVTGETAGLVRCVHMGGLVASVLTVANAAPKLAELTARAREWFSFDAAWAKGLVEQTASGGVELSRLLEIKTGMIPDVASILSAAFEQMTAAQEAVQVEAVQLRRNNDELARQTMTDGLTGAFNRSHFDRMLRTHFERCKSGPAPLGIVFIDADRFKAINDEHGHQTGDAVLMELSDRLRRTAPALGIVCRYGGEEFAIILPGMTLEDSRQVGEACRRAMADEPFDLTERGVGITLPVTISVGVSAMEPGTSDTLQSPDQITHAADQGVYAAKAAGRNRVFTKTLSSVTAAAVLSAAPAAAKTIMIVEDDPLASRLLSFLFSKCKDLKTVVVRSGEEAVEWVATPSASRPMPDAVVCDLHLPGMSGLKLIEALRIRCKKHVPFLVVSASSDQRTQQASMAAGADAFVDKADFCTNPDLWLTRVMELVDRHRAVAA